MKITIKREQRQMDLPLSSVSNLRGAKTTFLSALAISALLFSSCSDNEEPADNWNGEIRLSTASNSPQVKAAPNDQIASDQKVGLYISEDDTSPTVTYTQNLEYTANGNGGLTAAAVQYYPQSGKGVKISGYHPHNSGGEDSYDFTVAANQIADADYNGSDLLYSAAASLARQKTAHTLTFDHMLSKITYTLVSGAGDADITGATVKILNTLPTAKFDRINGSLETAKGTATTITPNAGGAIVVPQTIAGGTKLIEVTLASGGTLYHTVPTGGVTLEGGKVYNYTITANLTGISIQTTVKDWVSVGKDVTAEMD